MSISVKEKLKRIPPHFVSVADYEAAAQAFLPSDVWAYLQADALDDKQKQTNRLAFENHEFIPRVLDSVSPDLSCQLSYTGGAKPLDVSLPSPYLLSPIAHQKLFCESAELASLQAANVFNLPMIVSCLANTSFSSIAEQANAPPWLQLYWQNPSSAKDDDAQKQIHKRRLYNLALVEKAADLGFSALVVTVDAPHTGLRRQARKHSFVLPDELGAVNLTEINHHVQPANDLTQLACAAPSWSDIAWLAQNSPLPLLLKGILHPDDALKAKDVGAAGIVVSNHGRRILSDSVSVLDMLPKIRQVVGDAFVILADSGVSSGSDAVKLMCLGANAVCLGRAYIYGLSVADALGVAHVLKICHEELAITLFLLGAASPKGLNQNLLFNKITNK